MKVVLSILIALFVIACSNDANKEAKETKAVDTQKVEAVEEKSALETAKEKATEVKEDVTSKVTEAKDTVVAEVKEATESAKETLDEQVQNVKETTSSVVESVKETVADATAPKIDADLLYNKCAGCHGGMGEYAALGKSAVIRNWSVKQIEHALLGYKNGTYGRTMKAMMQGQVRNLSDAEIHALAVYISDK